MDDYAAFLDAARAEPRVVGVVLTGSRGWGAHVREWSDWDVRLVVRDDVTPEELAQLELARDSRVHGGVLTLAQLAEVAAIGSETEWDRYSYTHARVDVDKLDGRVTELVRDKGRLPADAARGIAAEALDAYVNSYYRSAKAARKGLVAESRLDAAESVPWLLVGLFALDGRVRPYNTYLRWELENHPLSAGGAWAAETLVPRLARIVRDGDIREQRRLFRDVETLFRARGFGALLDGWEPDLGFLRGAA
jgi:hypothetical protein